MSAVRPALGVQREVACSGFATSKDGAITSRTVSVQDRGTVPSGPALKLLSRGRARDAAGPSGVRGPRRRADLALPVAVAVRPLSATVAVASASGCRRGASRFSSVCDSSCAFLSALHRCRSARHCACGVSVRWVNLIVPAPPLGARGPGRLLRSEPGSEAVGVASDSMHHHHRRRGPGSRASLLSLRLRPLPDMGLSVFPHVHKRESLRDHRADFDEVG